MECHFRNCYIKHKSEEEDSRYYCWKLKKRKENTKYFLETTQNTQVDQPQTSVQSEQEGQSSIENVYEETTKNQLDISENTGIRPK